MEIDENGVVNPLRAPAFVRSGAQSVRAIPTIGLVFLILAGVDIALGAIEFRTLVPTLVGRALIVLFPTALLWRHRDAATATPNLFRGTVLLALAELGGAVARLLPSTRTLDDNVTDPLAIDIPHFVVALVLAGLAMAGWWLVGSALAGLRSPAGTGMRTLAAALVAGCAVAIAVGFVVLGVGTMEATPTRVVVTAVEAAPWIVTAYVGWVLVSRAGGLPRRATIAAAAGMTVQTIGSLPLVVIALVITATQGDQWIALQAVTFPLLSVTALLAPILFVFALATGLGDPPAATEAA